MVLKDVLLPDTLNEDVLAQGLGPLKVATQGGEGVEVRDDVVLKLPNSKRNAQIPNSILRFWSYIHYITTYIHTYIHIHIHIYIYIMV